MFSALAAAAPIQAQIQATNGGDPLCTPDWKGERFPDGRPRVSDDIVRRLMDVNTEEAWASCVRPAITTSSRAASRWCTITARSSGRALTVQYMPMRPDINKAVSALGAKVVQAGRGQPTTAWPDRHAVSVGYVGGRRVWRVNIDGTLIGDNLKGNSIYAKSKPGVVFGAGVARRGGAGSDRLLHRLRARL